MKTLLIILAALTFAGSLHAGPLTYNYLSGPLSAASGFPEVRNMTATFTADLAANLSNSNVTSLITNCMAR